MLHTTPAEGYIGNCAAVRDVDQRWPIGDIKAADYGDWRQTGSGDAV